MTVSSYHDPHDPDHEWIFTFGLGLFNNPARFIKVRGTYEGARAEVCRRFGTKWAFQYATEEAAGVQTWSLEEITDEQASLLEKLAAAEEETRKAESRLREREDHE